MPDQYTNIDDLLAKRLAGEAGPEEEQTIDTWLRATPANRQYFEGLQRLWQQARPITAPRTVDMAAALQKVKGQLHPQPLLRARTIRLRVWLPAAAAALALFIAALWFLRSPSPLPPVSIAATTTTLTDTLPDGSVVVLNRHSGLRISENFNRKERRMRLSGEAYFQVAPDAARVFVIEVAQLEVQVVGTEFNVDSRSEPGRVTVTVTTGRVQLRAAAQTELLQAGQQAVYDSATGQIIRLAASRPNTLAYKNRRFRFDSTPLRDVVRQLSDAYGIDISLKNKALENCPLSVAFPDRPLEEVLNVIAESFDLTVERSAGKAVLDGSGCD